MEWVETSARTEAEAVEAALDQLGVDESELEYEVLAKKTGFLGRFGGETRIRARVKPISREKPGEKRRRSKGRGDGSNRSSRPRGGDSRRQEGKPAVAATADGDAVGERAGTSGSGNGPNKRRRRRRGAGTGAGGGSSAASNAGSGSAGDTTGTTGERSADLSAERPARNTGNRPATNGDTVDEQTDVAIEDQAASAVDFVRGLLEAFGANGAVQSTIDDDYIHVDVEGGDLGLLVGPKGATLASVEELTRTVVQRRTGGHGARINVDVAGYRAKRREALSAFTRSLVEKVRESGKELALEPMGAADRKVVHDTVAEIEGFSTISEGEEPRRRVVIQPS